MMIGIMDKEVAKNIFWGAFTLGFVVGCLFTVIFWAVKPAVGQQLPDATKLAPFYQQQRNIANDGVAACALSNAELQAKIAELEKQLAEAKK
jgi:hypothetical protein